MTLRNLANSTLNRPADEVTTSDNRAFSYVRQLHAGPAGERLTRSERLVLLVLATYLDSADVAPPVWRLAEECCLSGRTVRAALRSAETKGVLTLEYRVDLDRESVQSRYRIPLQGGAIQ